MTLTPLEKQYHDYMSKIALSTLRMMGREAGVAHASSQNKDDLITEITAIYTGKKQPVQPSKRGAPVKQKFFSSEYMQGLEEIRNGSECAARALEEDIQFVKTNELSVASEESPPPPSVLPFYAGILEITSGGYGFVRTENCQPSIVGGDVYISASSIHSLQLREGDFITCTAKPRIKNDSAALDKLLSVNGLPVGEYERRPHFETLTAQYASEKIEFSKDDPLLSLRILDLFVPIGKGQRGLIIAPPKAGKTMLLKDIAAAISEHHRDMCLIVLLVDERPEEVTDFRTNVNGAEIIYSTFDKGAEHHVHAAMLAMEHAKRMAEHGRDVVVLLDSLTRLTRAYNNLTESTGKTLSGGLETSALLEPKRFFGAARNTVEAGSLTILATVLVDTGSRMDDVIYEEFKGTGNADIILSRELAERRVFPAIDIRKSGTRKEDLLLSKEEASAMKKLRERGMVENVAGVIDMMNRTKTNEEFLARIPEWLRVYKNV